MHAYLRAIGLGDIVNKRELKYLLLEVIENPDEQKIVSLDNMGGNVAELKKKFADNMGVLVHGYYDEYGSFQMEYYIPYLEGKAKPVEDNVAITRHVSRESFAGVCEDMRVGATLIYYIINGIDYTDIITKKESSYFKAKVCLSALSVSGTVLFPISKNEKQKEKCRIETMNRRRLMSEAKRGDEAAIESLTIEDLDTYTKISRRIRTEDVFTIVDSSFMPYGVECDQYSIIGEIRSVDITSNIYSQEIVYVLVVDCNDFEVSIGINKEDLTGEPQVGRRFKGSIWLLGQVYFDLMK